MLDRVVELCQSAFPDYKAILAVESAFSTKKPIQSRVNEIDAAKIILENRLVGLSSTQKSPIQAEIAALELERKRLVGFSDGKIKETASTPAVGGKADAPAAPSDPRAAASRGYH